MRYEIQKLLSVKGLVLWGVFLVSISLLYPLYITYNYHQFEEKYYENIQEASYQLYLCKKSARMTGKSEGIYFDYNMEKHSAKELEKELKKTENKDSYSYRDLMKEKSMMERCKLVCADVYFWEQYDLWEFCSVFCIYLFVLFVLSGSYTKERSGSMQYVLCTSRIGYRRIIADKWLAGGILGIGSILFVNINLVIAFIVFGSSSGYDVNIVNLGVELVYTPYNVAIWEYMLLKILFQSIGMLFLVVFAEYLSLRMPYRYPVVLFGGLLLLPQAVSYYAIGREGGGLFQIFDFLYDWSLLAAVHPVHAFYKYHSFCILGYPVSYVTLYLVLLIGLTVLTAVLTVTRYHKDLEGQRRCRE